MPVGQLKHSVAPALWIVRTRESGGWNFSPQAGGVRSAALDNNGDVDGLEKAGLAACFRETYCKDLPVGRLAIQRGQESEALSLIRDTCRVMKRLMRETAKAETPERAADAAVCRRLGIEHAERLIVLPHFRKTCL